MRQIRGTYDLGSSVKSVQPGHPIKFGTVATTVRRNKKGSKNIFGVQPSGDALRVATSTVIPITSVYTASGQGVPPDTIAILAWNRRLMMELLAASML